jgi:steroid Delta-isomerase
MSEEPLRAAGRAYRRYFEALSPQTLGGLRTLAAPDLHFRDPFNDVIGADKVIRSLELGYRHASDMRFEFLDEAWSGRTCYYRWRFFFRPKRFSGGRLWTIDGMSEVRFDERGLAVEHLDHWDAASQFYARLPLLGRLLELVRRRLAVD